MTRTSDNLTSDIGLLSDGFANAGTQDSFCNGTVCTITKIYDQTSNHNHLTPAPPGGAASGPGPGGYDLPAFATALPVTAGGHHVYGVNVQPGIGYRNDGTNGIATSGSPEGVYMVTSALNLNTLCCFDFGNAEVSNYDTGEGHMDALNMICPGTPCNPAAGLDVENGIVGFLGVPSGTQFVTAIGTNNGQTSYQIYQGNAQSGSLSTTGLTTLPSQYQPMHQEGAIILGIGGDNSNGAAGYFFEGAMTTGVPSSSTMASVQSNIVSANYAGPINLLNDGGFECDSQNVLGNSWFHYGPNGTSGVDVQQGKAHSGLNNGWTYDTSSSWTGIGQNFNVTSNTNYKLTAWFTCSANFGKNAYLGVSDTNGNNKTELNWGDTCSPTSYQQYTVNFNSGSLTTMEVYFGFNNGQSNGSWILFDDVSVVPQ